MTRKFVLSDQEWRSRLTELQYQVTRKKATERPFTGEYWDLDAPGSYRCRCCSALLFDGAHKFDAGCGWPSFDRPAVAEHIDEELDLSHGMRRTEVLCEQCGAHLGHVFEDGPTETGLRYCINSASVVFVPADGAEG